MSEIFKSQFTKIKDISDKRRLPRLGKIRLGVKGKSERTGKEYPKETEHFVCPPEVEAVYGKQPTTLDVMFPVNDPEVVFPQAYKYYGSSKGLKCIGNGEKARQANDDGTFEEIECPCSKLKTDENPKGECARRASLMVMLPKISLGGVYQIDLGSYHSIVDINSGIDFVRAQMIRVLGIDQFAFIPCVLKRELKITHFEKKKQKHYTVRLFPNYTIEQLNAMKQDARILNPEPLALPPIEEISPAYDPGAVVVVDEEDNGGAQPEPTEPTEQTLEEQYNDLVHKIRHFATKKKITAKECAAMLDAAKNLKTIEKRVEYLKTQAFAVEEGSKE